MAMTLPLSPLSSVSDPSTPLNSNNTESNNDGSRQEQQHSPDQMAPPSTTIPSTNTPSAATSAQMKRKPSRRANTAERRATHNAVERQRRETLNGRFLVRFLSSFSLTTPK